MLMKEGDSEDETAAPQWVRCKLPASPSKSVVQVQERAEVQLEGVL